MYTHTLLCILMSKMIDSERDRDTESKREREKKRETERERGRERDCTYYLQVPVNYVKGV